jgi:hypothetical protein
LNTETGGDFTDAVVYAFRDFIGDLVEEVEDGVGGGAVLFEEGFAEERGVEL